MSYTNVRPRRGALIPSSSPGWVMNHERYVPLAAYWPSFVETSVDDFSGYVCANGDCALISYRMTPIYRATARIEIGA